MNLASDSSNGQKTSQIAVCWRDLTLKWAVFGPLEGIVHFLVNFLGVLIYSECRLILIDMILPTFPQNTTILIVENIYFCQNAENIQNI